MNSLLNENQSIKQILESSKTFAMVGISSIKKEEPRSPTIRRPSIIVMKYLQEFGYKVVPVNPFSAGKKIHGETIVSKLENIKDPVDVVNVFRPSNEAPVIAKEAIKIGAKVLWLQYGIQSEEAFNIVKSANMMYVANKCIKQEYQKLFQKSHPVFPVLRNE